MLENSCITMASSKRPWGPNSWTITIGEDLCFTSVSVWLMNVVGGTSVRSSLLGSAFCFEVASMPWVILGEGNVRVSGTFSFPNCFSLEGEDDPCSLVTHIGISLWLLIDNRWVVGWKLRAPNSNSLLPHQREDLTKGLRLGQSRCWETVWVFASFLTLPQPSSFNLSSSASPAPASASFSPGVYHNAPWKQSSLNPHHFSPSLADSRTPGV